MGLVILGLRLLVTGVFGLAAVSKLVNRPQFVDALGELAVPGWLIGPVASGLPLLELGVAVALVDPATSWWAAWLSVLMLGCFSVVVGVALLRGRSPDCACFGGVRSTRIGAHTMVRNALLGLAAAALVIAGPDRQGPDPVGRLSLLSGSAVIEASLAAGLLIVVGCGGWLFIQVLRQNGRLLVRVEDLERRLGPSVNVPGGPQVDTSSRLPVGVPAPGFALESVDGRVVSLEGLCALGAPVLLVFSDPGCGPCRALLPELARWQQSHPTEVTVAVVSRGTTAAHQDAGVVPPPPPLLLQHDREVAQAYGAHATPTAVVVGPDGTVASELALGAVAISALLTRTAAQRQPNAARSIDRPPIGVSPD